VTVDGEHPEGGRGEQNPGGPVPDPDDRLWRHPSEIGRSATSFVAAAGRARARAGRVPDTRVVAVALLGGVIGTLLGVGVMAWSRGTGSPAPSSPDGAPTQPQLLAGATSLGTGLSGLVAKASPSVIGLRVAGGGGADEAGSAVVVGPGNLVLTARRLLRSRAVVTAQLAGGREEPATVVGEDVDSGLALLRVGGPPLTPLVLATSAVVNAGDTAVLVGRLRGAGPGQSPTTSVLMASTAAVARTRSAAPAEVPAHVVVGEIRSVDGDPTLSGVPVLGTIEADMLLDDDDIGGAVMDGRGELVGVTVASDDGNGGSSLAAPADIAQAVVAELASGGRVTRGYLGVEGGDAGADIARMLGLTGGAILTQVGSDSPAAAAGVRVGDVVTEVDGRDITNMARLRALLRMHHPGDTVRLVLSRRDETRTVQVVLANPQGGSGS